MKSIFLKIILMNEPEAALNMFAVIKVFCAQKMQKKVPGEQSPRVLIKIKRINI